MASSLIPRSGEHDATRLRLAEGTFADALRAHAPAGVRLRSEAELDESLEHTLRHHDPAEDLHVFGYGSLMWNPALDLAGTSVARAHGWHRRFCLRLLIGRGTAQEPGAMLALDRGGACHGLLLRIEAAKVRAESRLLWRREMLAGSYDARWVRVHANGTTIRALTFVVNRRHDRYIGNQPIDAIAELIRTGRGPLGTSRAYFDSTLQALARLGISDAGMERLRRAVLAADAQARRR
jgi:glutathione-specific gamma-glutamylcyclotransferase